MSTIPPSNFLFRKRGENIMKTYNEFRHRARFDRLSRLNCDMKDRGICKYKVDLSFCCAALPEKALSGSMWVPVWKLLCPCVVLGLSGICAYINTAE
jgi:hypothetical protein